MAANVGFDNLNMRICNWGRFGEMRNALGIVLFIVVGMVLAPPAAEAAAYLSSIGPAPMRFELATNISAVLASKPLRSTPPPEANAGIPASGNGTSVDATHKAAVETLSLAPTNINALREDSATAANTAEKANSELSPVSLVLSVPTEASSRPVALQELIHFFQPVPGGDGTNDSAVMLPVKIGFIPPVPAAVGSRAVYKSQ